MNSPGYHIAQAMREDDGRYGWGSTAHLAVELAQAEAHAEITQLTADVAFLNAVQAQSLQALAAAAAEAAHKAKYTALLQRAIRNATPQP